MYSEGSYFKDPKRHIEDSKYKVDTIKKIVFKYFKSNKIEIKSYADVGCGSGEIVKMLGKIFKDEFKSLESIKGYDVSPHIKKTKDEAVEFYFQDFTKLKIQVDLVTLNDVFEHVISPIDFLKEVGKRTRYVVMHIPLEDCLMVSIRNLQKKKIINPGHLLYLNINSALNLITFSGLKILDYDYSLNSINAPSNLKTFAQKILYPLKFIVLKINPYLYSKIFGISLIVIAKGSLCDEDR